MWSVDAAALEGALTSRSSIELLDTGQPIGRYWVTFALTLRNVQRTSTPDGVIVEGDPVSYVERGTLDDEAADSYEQDIPTPAHMRLRVVDPRPDYALSGMTYLESIDN
jgi:hypothetical protein